MALIPVNIKDGTLKKNEIIVGIDLGTTNSLIAIIDRETNKPIVISTNDYELLVPSIVYLGKNQNPLIGNKARKYLVEEPQNTIFSVKRLMGKSYKDVAENHTIKSYKIIDDNTESLVKIEVDGKFYTPVELSSFILKELKNQAESKLNVQITKAVITVPAYFNDSQRQATRDAGKLAGLDVLRIINEPTAASLAYGIGIAEGEQKIIAVYDLGGGTFDISILKITDGIFEVLSTNGDTNLGGDDFDEEIVKFWLKKYFINNDISNSKNDLQKLRLIAENAKILLSKTNSFFVEYDYKNQKIKLELSIDEFEGLINNLVEKTIKSCETAMKDANLKNSDIDEIILVGGSTRVNLVKEKVKQFFNKSELHDKLNPDETVALGAAIEADILAGNRKDILLLDVTPLSLGIETMGELMDVIIPRNSKVPQSVAKQYTTSKDGQKNLRISIYQGERDKVSFNRKLGEFNLSGIPAMPAGLPKIEISFMLDADGILKVKAKELRSGIEQKIEVKPQYGLTDEELEKMLLDSLVNAKNDVEYRSLQEAKTEAEQLIYTTQRFIEKNKNELSDIEIQQSNKFVEVLNTALKTDNKNEILKAHEALNHFTKPFAERLMDKAIAFAVKGKKIE
ncbi:MAG: molecular chaperone DnaK [Bacteroidetes bacterium]|nr:molecular chaperone DnaK [Bacteroidota bacterium]